MELISETCCKLREYDRSERVVDPAPVPAATVARERHFVPIPESMVQDRLEYIRAEGSKDGDDVDLSTVAPAGKQFATIRNLVPAPAARGPVELTTDQEEERGDQETYLGLRYTSVRQLRELGIEKPHSTGHVFKRVGDIFLRCLTPSNIEKVPGGRSIVIRRRKDGGISLIFPRSCSARGIRIAEYINLRERNILEIQKGKEMKYLFHNYKGVVTFKKEEDFVKFFAKFDISVSSLREAYSITPLFSRKSSTSFLQKSTKSPIQRSKTRKRLSSKAESFKGPSPDFWLDAEIARIGLGMKKAGAEKVPTPQGVQEGLPEGVPERLIRNSLTKAASKSGRTSL